MAPISQLKAMLGLSALNVNVNAFKLRNWVSVDIIGVIPTKSRGLCALNKRLHDKVHREIPVMSYQ